MSGGEDASAVVTLADAAATRDLGRRVGSLLGPGDLVVLGGDLGAGKTTLVQGLGEALGVRGPITSPTFVIARVHPSLRGGPDLVHVDAYRLGGPAELDDLDLPTVEAVTVVEWGTGIAEHLAQSRLAIDLDPVASADGECRIARVHGHGPRWSAADIERIAGPAAAQA